MGVVAMKKSPNHSKITGDFGEALVLYWLSKSGYECARVDHVGIDLLAFSKDRSEQMGVSVKCRSRKKGTEQISVNLPPDGFIKAKDACDTFGCKPYYAIVVDGAKGILCFLLPLDRLQKHAAGTPDGMRYWTMNDEALKRYSADPEIRWFELRLAGDYWPEARENSPPFSC